LELKFRELQKRDYKKVIQYAIKGMHFNMYINNPVILNLYGKYFWYLELLNATQVLALYYDDELAGVLIADINGEEKYHKSFSKKCYVKMVDFIQKHFFKESVGIYDEVNKSMLEEYKKKNNPDGEIRFLSANPDLKVKGIGTKLLNELAEREKGKEIYLFTDNLCTYQFYEHRDFEKVGEKDIELELDKKVPLKCLLYRKKL